MSKTLIITANPRPTSAVSLLAQEFIKEIKKLSDNLEEINICQENLPSFSKFIVENDNYGKAKSRGDENLPTEILNMAKKWRNADNIAFFVPNWWGTGPAELVDLFCWLSDEIAIFKSGKMPVKKMIGKKVLWINAGAAPFLPRKLFFKTDPEKWGKYIFSFSGAKFYSKFFDNVHMGLGEISENMKVEIGKLVKKFSNYS